MPTATETRGRASISETSVRRVRRLDRVATAFAVLASTSAQAQAQTQPHRSATELVSSNGRVVVGYDVPQRRITSFLEHPYRARSDGSATRDLAFDLYPGLRLGGVGTAGTWLTDVAPSTVEYENGTGILHIV